MTSKEYLNEKLQAYFASSGYANASLPAQPVVRNAFFQENPVKKEVYLLTRNEIDSHVKVSDCSVGERMVSSNDRLKAELDSFVKAGFTLVFK